MISLHFGWSWPIVRRRQRLTRRSRWLCAPIEEYNIVSVRTAQLCQTSKTRQKLDWKIREIDGSYLCMQWFDKFWIWSARNDRKWKLFEDAETCMKKTVKSHQVNLFLACFSHLKPMWLTGLQTHGAVCKLSFSISNNIWWQLSVCSGLFTSPLAAQSGHWVCRLPSWSK